MNSDKASSYWDSCYEIESIPQIPSQFAVFVLSELKQRTIVDIGCGNGRDSVFFAQQGIRTIGIDNSQSAVTICRSVASNFELNNTVFVRSEISDLSLGSQIAQLLSLDDSPLMVYSRFFLHAISGHDESLLLQFAHELLKLSGGWFALEFRTIQDQMLPKVTPDHFRRYIEPRDFIANASRHGFTCEYFVEGRGFAKFRTDDAHVARIILKCS